MVRPQSGFTLAELAVVLVIVGLLLGGLLIPFSAQNDLRYATETRRTLEDIRDALLGYATANGRLPCPASSTSNGAEDPSGGGACTHPYDGYAPGVTLGIGPTNSNGIVIDAWGNPIRYAVTAVQGSAFTSSPSPGGIKSITIQTLAGLGSPNPAYLSICNAGAAVTNAGATNAGCNAAGKLTDSAVAVVYSLGKNGPSGGTGTDEQHNPNPNTSILADTAFVSHDQSTISGNEFDDIMVWISPNTLYNRMITAGQLP